MKQLLLTLFGALLFAAPSAQGLMEEQFGPDSSQQFPTHPQPSWPSGMVELLRDSSRVYSIWVNGNNNVYFKFNLQEVQRLINSFGKIHLRDHRIQLLSQTPEVKSFEGIVIDYNVKLHFLEGIALWHTKRQPKPETYEPVLSIYLDPKTQSPWLEKLKIPPNIILENAIKGSALKSPQAQPKRTLWHAQIQFKDGSPAVDFEGGINTTLTFWDQKNNASFRLGEVDNKGNFHAAFSEKEIKALKSEASWITLTVGNYLNQPKKEHSRLPFAHLSSKTEDVQTLHIERPQYYYGRLLFEDDTPAVLDGTSPWSGADISVNFPYAGKPTIDKEGYFRLYFSAEQYAALLKRKPSKNIYVPLKKKGHGRATYIFPAEKLSQEKDKAGIVKIPKAFLDEDK